MPYYEFNQSWCRINTDTGQLDRQDSKPPVILCPFCAQDSKRLEPHQLNLDFRRRVLAIENIAQNKKIEMESVETDLNLRRVEVEYEDVVWETVPYKIFDINQKSTRECLEFSGNTDVINELNN